MNKKPWTTEEVELLYAFKAANYTNKEIAIELDRSEGSVEMKAIRHNLQVKKHSIYSDEELINILSKDINDSPNMNDYKGSPCAHTFINRFGSWNNAVFLAGKRYKSAGGIKKWTDDELIEILKNVPNLGMENFDRLSDLPCAATIANRFGSWEKALHLANKPINPKGFLNPLLDTHLYLIEFDAGFYKIGITQRSIKLRFSGYPKYTIILDIITSLEEAQLLENKWLHNVTQYQYIPNIFPKGRGGATECFKYYE